jgi:integrase
MAVKMKAGRPRNPTPEPFARKRGKSTVYYFCTYDEDGKRVWRSTGQNKISAARQYIRDKIEAQDLTPVPRITFKKFAEDFFRWPDPAKNIEPSDFIRSRKRKGSKPFSQENAYKYANILKNHIMPRFERLALEDITGKKIDDWTDYLLDMELSTSTVRHAYLCLKTIMDYAFKKSVINRNPFDKASPVSVTTEARDAPTLAEAHALLQPKYYPSEMLHLANLTAALTGLRISELCALTVDDLGKDRLMITKAMRAKAGVTAGTKNKIDREVPLLPEVVAMLARLQPAGYLFSDTGGETINPKRISESFNDAIDHLNRDAGKTVIDTAERMITFHSWRHFLTTQLGAANVTRAKIAAVRGDKAAGMVEHYTHFKAPDMAEIYAVQRRILGA